MPTSSGSRATLLSTSGASDLPEQIVLIPFPAALLGEYLLADHAAPAVVLYSSVCGFQAIGWNLLTRTALGPNPLTRNEKSTGAMHDNHRYSYVAFALYGTCALVAAWFPLTIAIAISWRKISASPAQETNGKRDDHRACGAIAVLPARCS